MQEIPKPKGTLTRKQKELRLADSFIRTVMASGQHLYEQEASSTVPGSRTKGGLSESEQSTFRRQKYYGWNYGLIAGLTTFGVLFGGARLVSRTRFRVPTKAFSEHALLQSSKPNPSANTSSSLSNTEQISMEVQALCSGALASITIMLVASSTFDRAAYFQELSTVPLRPGLSPLCSNMCPALLRQSQEQSTTDAIIWNDPETDELESIRRLVVNCQQRMKYEEKTRKEQNLDHETPVPIPEPGVPLQYEY